MYIVVGLGNPGEKFKDTRHNIGFKVIDKLAERNGIDVSKSKFKGIVGEGRIEGEKVILLKPQTFMNLSGDSVRLISSYYRIDDDQLLVIYDDADLPAGSIRIRKSGGPGKHNGMKSVVQEFGSKDFPRVRVGIGSSDEDLVHHVIGKVPKDEKALLAEAVEAAAVAVEDIFRHGIDNAMNMNNRIKESDET